MINIIAVDDELDAKILFDHFFKKEIEQGQVDLTFMQSAQACLDELSCKNSAQKLVITDINMPDMSGIELTERINRQFPDVKVFLVSAYDAGSQLDKIRHLNISEYITKPVDFRKLKEKIFQHHSRN